MFAEAASAPALAAAQIAANRETVREAAAALRALDPPFALTIARGSSDHAATFAKLLFGTRLRLPVVSQAPSIATLYKATSPRLKGTAVLAISQSGRSPDLIETARAAKEAGARLIVMVNDEDSPLAQQADHLIPLRAGTERSVAATKSLIASLSAIAHLVAEWQQDEALLAALDGIGAALEAAWAQDWSAAVEPLRAAQSLLVLGRGITWPIASEAALKFKETAQIHAEAFSSAEVAHGPMALVGAGDPILAFAPTDEAAAGFGERLAAFAERGATVIAAGEGELVAPASIRLPVARSADPVVGAIAMIQSFYRLAETLARAQGLDPDRPPFLSKVTRTL
jgi:glucosamine--fructose-6-phosphate aminotransferase (isomerizing)